MSISNTCQFITLNMRIPLNFHLFPLQLMNDLIGNLEFSTRSKPTQDQLTCCSCVSVFFCNSYKCNLKRVCEGFIHNHENHCLQWRRRPFSPLSLHLDRASHLGLIPLNSHIYLTNPTNLHIFGHEGTT